MKKSLRSHIFTVDIHSLSHDGRGIATINEKTTFVGGALPGEQVTCQITHSHSRYHEAKTLDVITAATDRVTPHCAHYGVCGGCSMQHMSADAQIRAKQHILLEQLKHFGKVTPDTILSPLSGNPWGYRRKARLGVRYVHKKERVLVGFREKYSNYLADISHCPVLHQRVGPHIAEMADVVRSLKQFEHIPQIEVAVSDEEAVLVFRHMQPLDQEDREKLCAFARKHNFHLYLQPNPPEKIQKLWPNDQQEKLTYRIPEYDIAMQFYPLDFVQVNGEVNQLLLKQALILLDPQASETILDLFCGLGNFTLPIARLAKHVIGVEGSSEMTMRAAENARLNHIDNVEFFAANLMESQTEASWMQKKYDKILLDPPRTGAKEIITYLKNFSAKKIVYVSCNPATLARDAHEIVHTFGYQLQKVGVVNMFPHTSHIEAIALFVKKS